MSRWIVWHDDVSRLRRSVVVEAVLGGVVLGLSAALVAAPPSASVATPPFNAALVAEGVIVDVAITPARTGPNEVHLVISPPGGALAPVRGATAELVRAEAGDVAVVELVSSGPNHLTGSVELSEPGPWELRVAIETEPGVVASVEAQVDVAG